MYTAHIQCAVERYRGRNQPTKKIKEFEGKNDILNEMGIYTHLKPLGMWLKVVNIHL